MRRALRSLSLASLPMLALLSATHAQAGDIRSSPQRQEEEKDWKFEVGGGAMFERKYEGSDGYTVTPIPHISIDYKDGLFFANPFDGIGSYPIQGENYKIGASVGLDFGRSESDDRKNLRGMGDIDMSATANLMGEYDVGPITLSAKLTKGNGDYGMTAEANVGTTYSVTEKLMLMGKVGMVWANADHMNSRFGVSGAQSARSGYAAYKAGSGIKSVGVSVGAFYSISENWDAMLMLSGDQLMGDAADSPIVKQKFQPTAMMSVSYKF